MELGSIKNTILTGLGWLSVIMGLISLAIINVSLLSGYDVPLANTSWVLISVVFGIISVFNKKSRTLGFWGLSISIFLGLFVVTIFGLGWTINPFP
ncbi:hypothetical protein MKY37_20355 [Psychrobacillus sp. FSL K6-2836]|uniref:hypothetical protein n=1 Tax=Psychrobacillus sp. FSL K6-2836 TaxID=2921548 RepID=UPI0030FC96C8